jgi:hypothetical protein
MYQKSRKISLSALLPVFYAVIIACMSGFVSCEDKSETGLSDYDPSQPVVLTSFYPDSGRIAEKVILSGQNFGSDPEKIKVYFNNKRASVIGANGNKMYVVCPRLPGDTCDISVVVGNDSLVYDQKFRYRISTTVTTITGDGTWTPFQGGRLADGKFRSWYIFMDHEDNLFLTMNETGILGLVRLSEKEDLVTALALANSPSLFDMAAPVEDQTTGILYAPHGSIVNAFYSIDPKQGYAVKERVFTWKPGTVGLPTNGWRKAFAYNVNDHCLYTTYYNGHFTKLNPATYEQEILGRFPQGDAWGMAFHPLKPDLLYVGYNNNAGVLSNGIYTIDINDPEGTFKRINSPISTGGFRDGDLATAQFSKPSQMYFDKDGNLYIADELNHCIRKITTDDKVETVVGIPGVSGWIDGGKEEARFYQPRGLSIGSDGSIYISDWGNARIRKLAIE